MPGKASDSRTLQLVGMAFFAVAVVGSVVLGWEFDGISDPLPTALALAAVAIAVGVTVLRRR